MFLSTLVFLTQFVGYKYIDNLWTLTRKEIKKLYKIGEYLIISIRMCVHSFVFKISNEQYDLMIESIASLGKSIYWVGDSPRRYKNSTLFFCCGHHSNENFNSKLYKLKDNSNSRVKIENISSTTFIDRPKTLIWLLIEYE